MRRRKMESIKSGPIKNIATIINRYNRTDSDGDKVYTIGASFLYPVASDITVTFRGKLYQTTVYTDTVTIPKGSTTATDTGWNPSFTSISPTKDNTYIYWE